MLELSNRGLDLFKSRPDQDKEATADIKSDHHKEVTADIKPRNHKSVSAIIQMKTQETAAKITGMFNKSVSTTRVRYKQVQLI